LLSRYKQNRFIGLFVTGITIGVNKNASTHYFHCLRLPIYQNSPYLEIFNGEMVADESYFDRYCKGKCSRGSAGKVAVIVIGF